MAAPLISQVTVTFATLAPHCVWCSAGERVIVTLHSYYRCYQFFLKESFRMVAGKYFTLFI
jgi:hypothetical protein